MSTLAKSVHRYIFCIEKCRSLILIPNYLALYCYLSVGLNCIPVELLVEFKLISSLKSERAGVISIEKEIVGGRERRKRIDNYQKRTNEKRGEFIGFSAGDTWSGRWNWGSQAKFEDCRIQRYLHRQRP